MVVAVVVAVVVVVAATVAITLGVVGRRGTRRGQVDGTRRLALDLVESERRYRLLAENSADVISVVEPRTWRFLYVSPSVLHQTGFTVDEVMGRTFDQTLSPDLAPLAIPALVARIAAFEAGDESQRLQVIETRLDHREFGTIDAEVVTTLLTDEAGLFREVLSV